MEMKPFRPTKLLRGLCAATLVASAALAHDATESTTVARLQHGRLEVTVTFSAPMATALVAEPGEEEAVGICASTFAVYQPRLLAKAGTLFEVRVDGEPMVPTRISVALNRMGEPEFGLIFPQPKSWPAKLRVNYLKELPARFSGTIQVFDEHEASLASRTLARDGEGAEVAVNPAPEPILLAPASPEKFAPPAKNPVAPRSIPLAPTICAVAVLLVVAGWMRRRKMALLLVLLLSVNAAHAQRQMERLGRGLVAVRRTSNIYVGWRLLGNDPDGIAFNLYRSGNGAAAIKLNATPITTTTDYTDAPPNLSTTAYTYTVKPVIGGAEVADVWANPLSPAAALPANATIRQYVPIPLQATPDGALDVKFCWVGDFDGDGEYDFVMDRTNGSVEAR